MLLTSLTYFFSTRPWDHVSRNFLKESNGKYYKIWGPENKNLCYYVDTYISV